MKNGWVTKKLGEVCEEIRDRISSAEVPVSAYITTDNMLKNCAGVCEAENLPPKICGLVMYRSGDILLSNIRPYLRKIWLADRNGGASSDVIVLRPISEKAFPRYIYRVLARDEFFDYSMLNVTGTKMPRGKRDWIKSFDIPIPPLAEQKRIVAKIDAAFEKIDKLKANAERNLANAKELFQSALDEAMRPKKGWVEKRLGEVCCKIGSGATPRGGKSSYCRDGISLIRSMNVYDCSFEYSELAHINNSQASDLDNVTIESDDVLINITGASVARCCVVPSDVLPARVNQHVSILRIADKNKILPKFLCYSLVAPSAKRVLLGIGEAGSTRQALTKGDLSDFSIHIPDAVEQKRIVQDVGVMLEGTNTLQRNYTQQIADCVEMRQAILREAFEGRL